MSTSTFKVTMAGLALALLSILPGTANAGTGGYGFRLLVNPTDVIRTPLLGFSDPTEFVKWMGCTNGTTVYVVHTDRLNAVYYDRYETLNGKPAIVIYDGLIEFLHDDVKLASVIAHEAGHCLQNQEGRMEVHDYPSAQLLEFDADAHAVKIMTVLGYDGVALEREIRETMARDFGIDNDTDPDGIHGSVNAISGYARTHTGLLKPFIGSPWAADKQKPVSVSLRVLGTSILTD